MSGIKWKEFLSFRLWKVPICLFIYLFIAIPSMYQNNKTALNWTNDVKIALNTSVICTEGISFSKPTDFYIKN